MSPLRTELGIALATFVLMLLYEATKEIVSPRLPSWRSHTITIVFTTVVAFVVSRYSLRAYRKALEELLQSKEPLRVAVDTSKVQVFTQDRSLRYTWVRRPLEGWTEADFVGRTDDQIYGHDDASRMMALKQSVLDRGLHIRREVSFTSHGRTYVCELSLEPQMDRAGKVVGVVGACLDVTRFHNALGDLRAAQDRLATELRSLEDREKELHLFRALIDQSTDAIEVVDPTTLRFLDVNDRACRDLGYTRSELLEMSPLDIDPNLTESRRARVTEELRRSRKLTLDSLHRRKDGSTFPVEINLTLIELDRPYVVAVARDISDRKRAEARLRESEERYRLLFERNLAGVYRSALDGRILDCNEAFAHIFGFSSRLDVLQAAAWTLYPSSGARDAFLARLREDRRVLNYQGQGKRKDGRDLWFLENASLVDDDTIEGTIVDLTEHRTLEAQLRQAQKIEAVGQLAGGVAHDFNNILAVILGYGEMLLREQRAEGKGRARIEQILKAADRAAALTRQLLAFSRKQVLEPRILDLNVAVREIEPMLRRLIGEHIQVAVHEADGLGRVKADPGQLGQVIMNLAVNARDAMEEGGRLTIETANAEFDETYARYHPVVAPGRYVMLALSDTGTGMDEETQRHMFEPFFTTKERGKGTGLGLAMVYGVVKQSDGYVWVYSEPGRGTTFKVYLPRVDAELSEEKRGGASRPRGSETILLAEDEESLRDLAAEILRERGYCVLATANGAEALERARTANGRIDLLLTDVIMPGMNGPELAERLRPEHPTIRVVYMSGYTDEAIARHGVLDSNVHLLVKPFTEALTQKVRAALRGESAVGRVV